MQSWAHFVEKYEVIHFSAYTYILMRHYCISDNLRLRHYVSRTGRHAVAQLVEALCCKSEGRGFDSPMVSLEFFIDIIIPAALWPLGLTQNLTEMKW